MNDKDQRVLEAFHLSVKAGTRFLLQDVNLALKPGTWLAVAGPNGCGKTTLLRALAGLLPYQGRGSEVSWSGEIFLRQNLLQKISPQNLSHARVYLDAREAQEIPLKVHDVLQLGPFRLKSETKKENGLDFRTPFSKPFTPGEEEILDSLDVKNLLSQPFPTLSTGEQRMVHLARNLSREVPLIFLDEPELGLDWKHWNRVVEILEKKRDQGAAIVSAHHLRSFLEEGRAELLILHQGRVKAQGSAQSVLSRSLLQEVWEIGE